MRGNDAILIFEQEVLDGKGQLELQTFILKLDVEIKIIRSKGSQA